MSGPTVGSPTATNCLRLASRGRGTSAGRSSLVSTSRCRWGVPSKRERDLRGWPAMSLCYHTRPSPAPTGAGLGRVLVVVAGRWAALTPLADDLDVEELVHRGAGCAVDLDLDRVGPGGVEPGAGRGVVAGGVDRGGRRAVTNVAVELDVVDAGGGAGGAQDAAGTGVRRSSVADHAGERLEVAAIDVDDNVG